MSPRARQDDTSLFLCRKCGIQTRHRWQRWNRPLPLRLLSPVRHAEGWICTDCGRRVQVRTAR